MLLVCHKPVTSDTRPLYCEVVLFPGAFHCLGLAASCCLSGMPSAPVRIRCCCGNEWTRRVYGICERVGQ